ncbi:hypothetical protein NESM_000581200 [Novymonas esmeraldas]|uniref:FCP1 homology domain-containing protein n=1 Tax=Novymonas esmeraldas TaxID=1808958 RepID=A0AAW0EQF8_9TRYP
MARTATRLPVHLLFDIDHTLVHPIHARATTKGPNAGGLRPGQLLPSGDSAAKTSWPLSYSTSTNGATDARITSVLLRPHVVSLLSQILCRRALDTSEVCVHVSLYTRQCAAYCAAVAQQVLLPALHAGNEGGGGGARVHGLYSAEQCVRGASVTLDWRSTLSHAPAHPASDLDGRGGAVVVVEPEWCKTIGVSPWPLTTLLVDDRSANLRAAELRTGHGVLVPSYYADSVEGTADDCFAVPSRDHLHDRVHRHPREPDTTTPVRLMDIFEAFVQCCHDHRATIEDITDASATARALSPDALLAEFDFFDRSPRYRRHWNAFHSDCEDLLHCCLTC